MASRFLPSLDVTFVCNDCGEGLFWSIVSEDDRGVEVRLHPCQTCRVENERAAFESGQKDHDNHTAMDY